MPTTTNAELVAILKARKVKGGLTKMNRKQLEALVESTGGPRARNEWDSQPTFVANTAEYKKMKAHYEELKEVNEQLEAEAERTGELESIIWIDFYGEKEVIDDIKAYRFRDDIIDMKKENKELKEENDKLRRCQSCEDVFKGLAQENEYLENMVLAKRTEIEDLKEKQSQALDEHIACERTASDLNKENNKLMGMVEQDATPVIIETVREWFLKSNTNPLMFLRWTNADPVIMIQNLLKEYDEYYQKQKDYEEKIEEIRTYIELGGNTNEIKVFNDIFAPEHIIY